MSSLEEERREVGRMLISKQSLWSRQRCCYYYHHRPPSPDFNQVLNTSIVAPGRGSSRLLFFLPLSNRIEPRHGYCTNALGLARLCSPSIGWIRSVLERRKRFWSRTRGDRCATGIVKGLWIRGGIGVTGYWRVRKEGQWWIRVFYIFLSFSSSTYIMKKFIKIIVARRRSHLGSYNLRVHIKQRTINFESTEELINSINPKIKETKRRAPLSFLPSTLVPKEVFDEKTHTAVL